MKGREDMDDMEILEKLTEKVQPKAKPEKKKRVVKRTEAQRASEDKYKKEKQKRFSVNFFPPDYDLYEHAMTMASESSISAYIKRLIREDMERSS